METAPGSRPLRLRSPSLEARPFRASMPSVAAVPHSPLLEEVVLPQTDDVINAAVELLQF